MCPETEITAPLALLDAHGHLTRPGWARHPLWRYQRDAVAAPRWRIKAWDYYSLLSPENGWGLTVTVADLGYVGLLAVCFLDFERAYFHQVDKLLPFPLGRMGLGDDSDRGSVHLDTGTLDLHLDYGPGQRSLYCRAPGLRDAQGQKGLEASITLRQDAALQSMNICSAWAQQPRAFYYNRKINCLPAQGSVRVGATQYTLHPERDFGALDWGRGHWPWRSRWYWSSASGWCQGHALGWNLGYGFSDRSAASENLLLVDGVAHKLGAVRFDFSARDYLQAWHLSSADGRLDLHFTPVLDRRAHTHLGLVRSLQHQVFGYFDGVVVPERGPALSVQHMLGFAEDVLNWW